MIIIKQGVSSALVEELEESFYQGPMLDDEGMRMLTEVEVSRINKMSIQIQSDEHPPPHFHVQFAGENASFAIDDGRRLPNIKGLEKYDKNIRKWWKTNKCELIISWNAMRPTDCPVGAIAVPPECSELELSK